MYEEKAIQMFGETQYKNLMSKRSVNSMKTNIKITLTHKEDWNQSSLRDC